MLITQYPFIDDEGVVYYNFIKYYSDQEHKGVRQIETGTIFDSAVDIYPSPFTYEEVDLEEENKNKEREDN